MLGKSRVILVSSGSEGEMDLSTAVILPEPKSLDLCQGCIGYPGGTTDVVNIFNAINNEQSESRQNQAPQ
ncbi:MAG: hypothetical protein ACFCD0_04765 [Gemmataceae bacterium]